MGLRVSNVLQAAQMAATLARADTGAGVSRLRVYGTARPDTPGDHADTPMCEIALDKPCGSISAGVLALAASAAGMVMSLGTPRWAEWIAADGALLADGSVTDADHGGDFRVSGASTPPGETSPTFVAGALMSLGVVALT